METLPTLCVSAAQVQGWCDYKVADVICAVVKGTDVQLQMVLEGKALRGGIMSNFLPLPFSEDSAHGQRLTQAWERVKEEHPNSEIARTFVWKFWRPDEDSVNAHLMHGACNEAPVSYEDARARAYSAAGVRFH